MGVLACGRSGCDNIMCDRYSPQHGYICYDCFKELVESGAETDIANFMRTIPNRTREDEAYARFNIVFPVD